MNPIDKILEKLKDARQQPSINTQTDMMNQALIEYFEWKQKDFMERMSPAGTQPSDNIGKEDKSK